MAYTDGQRYVDLMTSTFWRCNSSVCARQ